MIQVKKDDAKIPDEYKEITKSKKVRKIDLDSGCNRQVGGRELFKKLKQKAEFETFKKVLLNDQFHICCYCNARVTLKGSTVEHIIPIGIDKSLLSEYSNLLVACDGGRADKFNNEDSQNQYPLYCDANRNNSILPFTPLDLVCWSAFDYSIIDGSVSANNNAAAQQMIDILNLDCPVLRRNRLEALKILFDENEELLSYSELEKIWVNLWGKAEGKYEPYFFAIVQNIYYLV
jgi:uncharacterized protein (TIGR02646 family)